MSALDRYDPNMVDDEDYSELSQGDRAAAEASMRKRDRAAGIRDDRDLLYGGFLRNDSATYKQNYIYTTK